MKNVFIFLILLLAAGFASANLLSNGDFALGSNGTNAPDTQALNWSYWNSSAGGWNNRETNPNGLSPDNYHVAIGNAGGYGAGAYQDVPGTAGTTYVLSADAALDDWWLNSGYLKIEFYDGVGTAPENMVGFVESPHFSQPNYDLGLPWANYSLEGTAPAGTQVVRGILGTYGEGGTARFDNVVLELGIRASNPNPENGAVVGTGLTTLSWTNPDPNNPSDTITVDVYILDAGELPGPLVEDPNLGPDVFALGAIQLADDDAIDTIDLNALPASVGGGTYALTEDHYYYWAVHCTDPNSGGPVTTQGDVWYFYTGDASPVANAGPDQFMWLAQDDSDLDGGENSPNVKWFQVVGTYTDDGKSPIVDANFVNLGWGWDPDGGEYGVIEVSDVHTPNPDGPNGEHSGTVTAVYKTVYEGDPNNTSIPGYWNIQLQVTDGTGTATDTSYHRIDIDCGTAAENDSSDPFDGYYDVNNDCIINLKDFAAFAEKWLDCNTNKLECL